ncbi:MAG: OmpA family protein [Elusimicrobia bacterium]|nr:OmpA family protein [Elusimicrobiota bacterium]
MPRRRDTENLQVGTTAPGWMVTYGDLMTQLLIFFVMMFALASAMNELQLIDLKKKMDEYIARENLTDSVSLEIDKRGLIISFHGRKMYDEGASEISPVALSAIKNLAAFVRSQPNEVRVEGHTDRDEVSKEYPSHWDLSVARASYVSKFLINEIYFPPNRISSSGYAEQKPYLDEKTREALLKRKADLLKTAKQQFLYETKKMLVRKIEEKFLKKKAELDRKYASKPNGKVIARLKAADYRAKITRKYDKIFEKIRSSDVFSKHSRNWTDSLAVAKLHPDEVEILGAKEIFIKAQYFKKLQKEIIDMANLTPSQRGRNRRVDLIVARISSAVKKGEIL